MVSYFTRSDDTYPFPPLRVTCVYYNRTTKKIFTSAYEGIPENLLINISVWMILILLFAVLRKRAWNYGRIALRQRREKGWMHLFYGSMDDVAGASEAESITSLDSSIYIDKGFWSWLTAIFRLKDGNISKKCGPDAVQYLSFQRHIIVYMLIMMITSLTIVLPINFQGIMEGDERTFGHTTLSNLHPDSSYLWIHVTLAVLYMPLGIIIMRRFSATIQFDEGDRTLMITKIPVKNCDLVDLRQHFCEAYPKLEIQNIQLAYNISRVSVLDEERKEVHQARLYCENYMESTRTRLDMRPYACGNICGCCGFCPTVDAIEYYAEEEARLQNQVDQAHAAALKTPFGIAFVMLRSVEAAQKIYDDHKYCNNPPISSVSCHLKPHKWHVHFASSPEDIYWEHLSVPSSCRRVKAVLINLILFLVLFFFTTPVIVINYLDNMTVKNEVEKMSPVLSEFLPTLLLWTVAALLPALVSYSDKWLSHRTRSQQNLSVMKKTFLFLLFMVLILPSLGLTRHVLWFIFYVVRFVTVISISAQALVHYAVHYNETNRWACLFLPDKEAFFVNYVTTSALIGTALELIRFPGLIVYAVRWCLARSQAEAASVPKAALWEFPFGVQYAWMLLIFAMTTTYSLSCPLITPFGLLYMVLKHLVDRYNIYFAYGRSKISYFIHEKAIYIVIISILLLQLNITLFSILRHGFSTTSIYSLTGFCITLLFLCTRNILILCRYFCPVSYQIYLSFWGASNWTHSQRSMSLHQLGPDVLQPPQNDQPDEGVQNCAEGLSILQQTYGTQDDVHGEVVQTTVSPDSILSSDSRIINTHDRTALCQDYDYSDTKV